MLKLNLHKGGRSLGSKVSGRGVAKSRKIFQQPSQSTGVGGQVRACRGSGEARQACQLPEQDCKGAVENLGGCCVSQPPRLEPCLGERTWGCYSHQGPSWEDLMTMQGRVNGSVEPGSTFVPLSLYLTMMAFIE